MNRLLLIFELLVNKSSILVGGQAVMEGVMMRVPGAYATAVRDSKGNIQTDRHEFQSITASYPLLNVPLVRGIFGLFESLKIGYSTLQWSANIIADDDEKNNPPNKFLEALLTVFSISLAMALFFVASFDFNHFKI